MGNPKNREIVKCFYKFLKTHKIEEKYVNNFFKYYSPRKKLTQDDMIAFIIYRAQNGDSQGLLSSAFAWSKTDEGGRFWSFMQHAWRRYLYKNKLLNDIFY